MHRQRRRHVPPPPKKRKRSVHEKERQRAGEKAERKRRPAMSFSRCSLSTPFIFFARLLLCVSGKNSLVRERLFRLFSTSLAGIYARPRQGTHGGAGRDTAYVSSLEVLGGFGRWNDVCDWGKLSRLRARNRRDRGRRLGIGRATHQTLFSFLFSFSAHRRIRSFLVFSLSRIRGAPFFGKGLFSSRRKRGRKIERKKHLKKENRKKGGANPKEKAALFGRPRARLASDGVQRQRERQREQE